MVLNAFWACKEVRNMGDRLTPYIIKKIIGDWPTHSNEGKHFILSGSILQETTDDSIVLGAGFGAKDQIVGGKPKLYIVRGPLSGEMLNDQGFETTWIYGDPGVCMPLLYKPDVEPIYEHGILPHYIDHELFEKKDGVLLINITDPVETVINQMLKCRTLETSSLHGLILGDVYGIPTELKKYSNNIAGDGMKYEDYRASEFDPQLVLATIKEHLYECSNDTCLQ